MEWERELEALVDSEPTCEVFVRSLCPPVGAHQQQERILERLQTYEREGAISDVIVRVWGEAICPSSCVARSAVGSELLDRVQTIREWTDDHGTDPVFEVREVHSTVTGESYLKLLPPRVCVLVSDEDGTQLVFPHVVDDQCACIDSFLDAFDRRAALDADPIEASS
jgi:hypothetical protein